MTAPALGFPVVAPELRPNNLGGAGHFVDITFPSRQVSTLDQTPGTNNNESFIRALVSSTSGVRVGLGGGTADTYVLAAGSIPCLSMNSTAAVGVQWAAITGAWHGALNVPIGGSGPAMRVASPFTVCRIIFRIATEAPNPAANRDMGLSFAQPTAGTNAPYGLFVTAGATGFALNRNANAKWSLDVKAANGGAVTRNELNINALVFHTMEFRIFEATAFRSAYYQFFVDGVDNSALIPLTCRDFGTAGTLLPQNDINTARYSGFIPALTSNGGAAGNALYVHFCRIIIADSLASALT